MNWAGHTLPFLSEFQDEWLLPLLLAVIALNDE